MRIILTSIPGRAIVKYCKAESETGTESENGYNQGIDNDERNGDLIMRASEFFSCIGLVAVAASVGVVPFAGMNALGLIIGGLVIGIVSCLIGMVLEDQKR